MKSTLVSSMMSKDSRSKLVKSVNKIRTCLKMRKNLKRKTDWASKNLN